MFKEDAREEAWGRAGRGQGGCKGTKKNRHCVSIYKNVTSFVGNRAAEKAHVGNPGEGAAHLPCQLAPETLSALVRAVRFSKVNTQTLNKHSSQPQSWTQGKATY